MKKRIELAGKVTYRVFFCFVLIILGLSACVTTEQVTYLQEYESSPYTSEYTPPEDYRLQSSDNLYIRVATPDPTWSAIFNPSDQGGAMAVSEESIYLYSYPVQLDGTVDIPYVGSVEVAGKTIAEAKDELQAKFSEYVRDAALMVKLVHNSISILGEVRAPGLYPIYKDRLNIYQALALAGDVADYGDRYTMSIMRSTTEGTVVKKFDITDRQIIDSEYYYVHPNDILYIKPMKGRFFSINQAPYVFGLTVLTTAISIFILIQNSVLINNNG